MQKIVLDTNVLVSSLIQRGYSFLIVNELLLGKKTELYISFPLLEEYHDVLNRKKFSKYTDFFENAKSLLYDIESISQMYYPKTKLKIISDLEDNKLLELASESKANFIVTGNLVYQGYLLRPENIESCFYLYRLTKDDEFLYMGERMINDILDKCKTESGYFSLKSVKTLEPEDWMDSFFLAETLKYAYLLFAPEETFDINKNIFNTEAHPLKKF